MITTVTESEWNLIPVRVQNDFQVAECMKSVARLGKYLSLFYEMLYYRRTVEFYKEKIRDAYTNKSGRAVRLSIYTHTLRDSELCCTQLWKTRSRTLSSFC
jgi:hypothetical protein